MRNRADRVANLPDIACACATLRRATRLITQLYDEEFRPSLQASQFALLAAIGSQHSCDRPTLMRTLAFDKTTLSRNLSVLKRKGWIRQAADAAHPERSLRLTARGRAILAAARPHWRRAQNRLRSAMTEAQWNNMWLAVRNLTNTAHRLRHDK